MSTVFLICKNGFRKNIGIVLYYKISTQNSLQQCFHNKKNIAFGVSGTFDMVL